MQSRPEGEPLLGAGITRVIHASWSGGGGGLFVLDPDGLPAGLAPYWWVFLLRGLLVVAFGLFCLLCPGLTLLFLTYVFGYFMIFDGLACIFKVFGLQRSGNITSSRSYVPPGIYFLNACCDLVIGIFALVHPGVTEVLLLMLVATWFLVTGLLEIIAACIIRSEISDSSEWFLGIGGLLSCLLGILMFQRPAVGIIAFLSFTGAISVLLGLQIMYVGTKLKSLHIVLRHSGNEDKSQETEGATLLVTSA